MDLEKHILISALSLTAFFFGAQAREMYPAVTDSLPVAWTYSSGFSQTLPADDEWWRSFNDPVLTGLIEAGQRNNYDVAMAGKRIEIARNSWKSARAGYFPTVSASAGWNAQRESERTAARFMETSAVEYFSLGLQMEWELDVFGRIAAGRKAARAAYDVSEADYEAAMVTLAANIAKAYIKLRVAQMQLQVTREHIKSQAYVADIAKLRQEAGLNSGLDVSQARQVLLSTETAEPELKATIAAAVNSLAVLTGRYPSQLPREVTEPGVLPEITGTVDVGVPVDLLRRRPDLVAAEKELAGYAASIGVAKKDFLPVVSLTASASTDAHRFDDLFGKNSFGWSVAPQISWTVFDGLARNYKVAEARYQLEMGVDSYNMTVLSAWQEVENAMALYTSSVKSVRLEERFLEQTGKTLAMSFDLYRQGLTDFTDVADAQISDLQARNGVISSRGNVLTSLVTLYQALGGGWNYKKVEK